MMMKDSLFLLISNVLRREREGPNNDDERPLPPNNGDEREGPIMMMKDSLFLLISNILGRGPSNDYEGSSVSVVFKCFRKGAQK